MQGSDTCGEDLFSGGACKDGSCREDVRRCFQGLDAHGQDLFSGGAFKDRQCREDLFSGGACKDQTHAGRICLAEVLARIGHMRGGFV